MLAGSSKNRGFTLIELMMVVAIIGILAAIAIPSFLKYQAKARTSEAKANLKGIFTSEMAYYTETGQFNSLAGINYPPIGTIRYSYSAVSTTAEGGFTGTPTPSPATWASSQGACSQSVSTPGNSVSGFTAVAWGTLSAIGQNDQWAISDQLNLCNSQQGY